MILSVKQAAMFLLAFVALLPDLNAQSLKTFGNDKSGKALTVAFGPDGKTFLAGYKDGSILKWDINTGTSTSMLQKKWGSVNKIILVPQTNNFAVASSMIKICDYETGKDSILYTNYFEDYYNFNYKSLAINAEGTKLAYALASEDIKGVRIVGIGIKKNLYKYLDNNLTAFTLLSNTGQLVTCQQNSTVSIWTEYNNQLNTDPSTSKNDVSLANITDITNSVDGRYLAAVSTFGGLIIIKVPELDIVGGFQASQLKLNTVQFSSMGYLVALAGKDKSIYLYEFDPQTNKIINVGVFNGHSDDVNDLCFSLDGSQLLSAGKDGTVKLWDCSKYTAKSLFAPEINAEISANPSLFGPKSEFETTNDYLARKARADTARKEITNKYIQNYAFYKEKKIRDSYRAVSVRIDSIGVYNADNQSLNMYIDHKSYNISISPGDAKTLKENVSAITVNASLQLRENATQSEVFNRRFYHPVTGKIYYLGLQKSPLYLSNPDEVVAKLNRKSPFPFYPEETDDISSPSDAKDDSGNRSKQTISTVSISSYQNNKRKDTTIVVSQSAFPNSATVSPKDNAANNQSIITPNNTPATVALTSEIDQNIPAGKIQDPDAIAVVIGNTDYTKTKPVDFAENDARTMRNYLMKTMGYKPANILYYENANLSDLFTLFGDGDDPMGKLYNTVKAGKSNVFIYFSGHGAPGLKDHKGYIVPVECDPNYVEFGGYPTDLLYANLSKVPAKSITIVMDACFSGTDIYENISPIVIRSNQPTMFANGLLLASCSQSQVSAWYNEKYHGLFTYFFLKGIQSKEADLNKDNSVTVGELYQYVSDKSDGVPYEARRLYGIDQNPELKGTDVNKVLVKY